MVGYVNDLCGGLFLRQTFLYTVMLMQADGGYYRGHISPYHLLYLKGLFKMTYCLSEPE